MNTERNIRTRVINGDDQKIRMLLLFS